MDPRRPGAERCPGAPGGSGLSLEAIALWVWLPRGHLRRVGLEDRAEHRLFELSLGQQQRVAVARALAPDPRIVLADEPTAEIDQEAANVVIEALREVSLRGGGVILASHDPRVLLVADRVLVLRAGRLVAEGSPAEVAEFITTD